MASQQPALTDPDKLGLLIQCRMKMDKLNDIQLRDYTNSIIKLLPIQQLKKLLFVGLNSIKNDIQYDDLFQMRSSINQIIEEAEKLKNKNKPIKKTTNKPTIPIVRKNASLTMTIPFDILSNHICAFLKMSSITNLAKCDRKSAIVCHTPVAISNLMHRYNPYNYVRCTGLDSEMSSLLIDGHFPNMLISDFHRFKNVETLAISLQIIGNSLEMLKFISFQNVKHLSLYDADWIRFANSNYINGMKVFPSLQTISFVNVFEFCVILSFLDTYISSADPWPQKQYYNKTIYGIKSIQFIDTGFETSTIFANDGKFVSKYNNMLNFILQSQPNNLQILKFENSYFEKSNRSECNDSNEEFANIERVKMSLANLKGFVYGESSYATNQNIFFTLTHTILSNLISFNTLESLHIHSSSSNALWFLNDKNKNALKQISELCISISMNQTLPLSLTKLTPLMPKLNKLCLVMNISDNITDATHVLHLGQIIESIFRTQIKLKLFQIVVIMGRDCNCSKIINILTQFSEKLIKSFNTIRNCWTYSTEQKKQPLLFKYHIKSCHYEAPELELQSPELERFAVNMQSLITNYLMAYPVGKIQFKFTWNVANHRRILHALQHCMDGLNELFRVVVNKGGTLQYCDDPFSFSLQIENKV